jgi:formylglycine-generating enzyme required for sulfatase activity
MSFFLSLVLTVTALSAQTKPRLAILPFTGPAAEDAESIAEFFSYEEEINRVFTPVPRTRAVENLMKEQQFQRSGLTDSDTIADIGKQLNADYVLAGHIAALGTSKLLLITIINVKELQQIAGDYREYQRIEGVVDILPAMAKRIGEAARQDTARRNLPRLAVLPFNVLSSGMNQGDAELLAQILATELANSGSYAVFPRTRAIEKVMEEHHIERSGMTDPESIRAIGAAVNAQYVLSANVRKLGADNYFSASILHIVEASQGQGAREKYRDVSDGLTLMPRMAQVLTGGTPAGIVPANMILVEGGTFQMGSTNGGYNEKPVHRVTVKSFYMGKYEVTQKEWTEVMGTTMGQQKAMLGSPDSQLRGVGDNYPIYYVNWYEAVEYCNRLSLKEGLNPAYRGSGDSIACDFNASGYRLPTEAEWEYAASGGNKTFLSYAYPGGNSVDRVAWYYGNSGNSAHPAGTKQANDLGLYDMGGNVGEWCWDWYGSYGGGTRNSPTGPSSGTNRVVRGGSWRSSAGSVRSANRNSSTPSIRYSDLGFRLVRPQF